MSLKDKLMEDLKTSMRERDKLRKDTITMIRAAIKQREVDERVEMTDEQILDIISKQFKEKKSDIEEFKKGNRDDLVDQAKAEMEILLDYMPKQLTDDELKEIVKETIGELKIESKAQIGQLMKNIMPKVKGKADGKQVNRIALELLN